MLPRRVTLIAVIFVGLCGQARAQTLPLTMMKGETMIVFFDWRKDKLTDRAQANVKEAAEHFRALKAQQIRLFGTTDTSLPKTESEALSRRMADAVAAELIRDGVPKKAIEVFALGWSHPELLLVKTDAGVREPQNRNVSIAFFSQQ